jgi:dihydroneopterin aldolase
MSLDSLLRQHRRLFLRGLSVPVRIGIHDFELAAPQRIVFDIELYVSLHNTTPRSDHIGEVVDYDFVREVVHARVARGHINLQETLGDDILDALLAHPGVAAASVSTRKPDVYPDCDAVGVQTFRAKPGVVWA